MSITYEEYISGNNKYQIDKVIDSNGVYYNVYDKELNWKDSYSLEFINRR